MSKFRFLTSEKGERTTTVIIDCGRQKPASIEDFTEGHEGFDIAQIVLRSELLKRGWVDKEYNPIGCYIDIRSNLGLGDDGHWYFALSGIWMQTPPPEDECEENEPWKNQSEQTPEITSSDKEGKYTLEDLLGEM